MDKLDINYMENLASYKIASFIKNYSGRDIVIVCVGTDKCIGDSLGPFVGSMLKERKAPIPVYGTLDYPVHALNIKEKIDIVKNNHPFSKIIGIDACIGNVNSIGVIEARDFPIHPGKGVGKTLPDVGDISIIGIVDGGDDFSLFTNRNIRLSLIVNMAKIITNSIMEISK